MKPLYRTLIIYCIVILSVIFSAYLIQRASGTAFRYEYQQERYALLDAELKSDLSSPNLSPEDIENSKTYNEMVRNAVATEVIPVGFIERFALSWDGIDLAFIKWIVFVLIMLLPITVVGLYHTSESVILGMLIAFAMLAISWLATLMNWYVLPSSSGWIFPSSTVVSYLFVIVVLSVETSVVANIIKTGLKKQEATESQNIPLEQEIVINKDVSQEIKYAGFLVRFAATSLDWMIAIIAILVFLIISTGGLGSSIHHPTFSVVGTYLIFLVMIASFLYSIIMTHNHQATFGKKLLGIQVMSDSGVPLSLGKTILRESIGKLISLAIFAFGFMMVAPTKKKQALHDMIVKSVVVYKQPTKEIGKSIVAIAILNACTFCAICVFVGVLFISSSMINETDAEAMRVYRQANRYKQEEYDSIYAAGRAIDEYFEQHGTYSGFELTGLMSAPIQTSDCDTKITFNISPDGSKYVLHRPFCGNLKESDCLENGSSIGWVSDTATVEKTFHCR